jgi:predicted transcriptional regulator
MATRRSRTGDADEAGADVLTPAQLELMNLVWEHGELTVSEVRRLLGKRRPVARTTVLTLLGRLEDRGWLAHRAEGRTFRYRALRSRKTSVGAILRRLRDTVFGGSTEGAVAALLEEGVTREEVRRIRRRLAGIERQEERGGRR